MSRLPTLRQKRIIWDEVGYVPNEAQMPFHAARIRRILVAGGERAGKSFSVAKELLARLPFGRLFWILGPDYEQTRAEFGYLLDDLLQMDAIHNVQHDVSTPRVGPWYLKTKTGQEVQTKSSAFIERIAGKAPDGIVLAEAAQQSYDAYLKTYGRLSQQRGWLIAVGTFEEGFGWYPDVYDRWQGENEEKGRSYSLPTWSNLDRYPGGREDPEIKLLESLYPEDAFNERFGAKPAPPKGLVFKEFNFTIHVQKLDVADNLPVELWIDPGYAGAYAVLAVQLAGGWVHVIDEVYAKTLVAQDVIAICKRQPWWPLVPKASDGKVGGVIDIAGTQHHAMPSQVETWMTDADVSLFYQPVSIHDGIQALRVMLRDPGSGDARIFFNSHLDSSKDGQGKANGTLAEFKLYKFPQWKDGKPVSETPIDANNHGLKALGYGLYRTFGPVGGRPSPPPQVKRKGFATR